MTRVTLCYPKVYDFSSQPNINEIIEANHVYASIGDGQSKTTEVAFICLIKTG